MKKKYVGRSPDKNKSFKTCDGRGFFFILEDDSYQCWAIGIAEINCSSASKKD